MCSLQIWRKSGGEPCFLIVISYARPYPDHKYIFAQQSRILHGPFLGGSEKVPSSRFKLPLQKIFEPGARILDRFAKIPRIFVWHE